MLNTMIVMLSCVMSALRTSVASPNDIGRARPVIAVSERWRGRFLTGCQVGDEVLLRASDGEGAK